MKTDLSLLEEITGYHFKDRKLLLTALTHTSYANEHRRENVRHNERLEFLGYAVLETVSSEYLFKKYPEKGEGELSTTRASMVCEPSLAICARDLGLPDYLRLGRGEEQMGGRLKDSIISDAVESLIGAMYLDGGFDCARTFILEHILGDLRKEDLYRDNKTALQELVQQDGGKIEYVLVGEDGPDHAKTFTISVLINGEEAGRGEGRTKKAASQKAAKAALGTMKAGTLCT